jgi:hypothetical protein
MKNMMKQTAMLLLLTGLMLGVSSCIMEDRVIELVVTNESCADFTEDAIAALFVTPATVDYGNEINQALEDNNVSREDIVTARVVSASYGVTSFSQTHDWQVSGAITVERNDKSDGPSTLINYTDQSIADALGKMLPVDLNSDGVGLLDRALSDFIAGGDPILTLKVNNGGVSPLPSVSDPIRFTWQACIVVHIVTKKDMQVPDPF